MSKKKETPEMITITKSEYDRLVQSDEKLGALEAAGVDNWCGYGAAMEDFYSDEEEEEEQL